MDDDTPWPSATCVHPSLAGATNYEQAHEHYWHQLTLAEAVLRGEKLRKQKVTAPRWDKEYKVIGLEYIKRPPLRKRCSQSQTSRYGPTSNKNVRPKNTPKRLGTCDFTNCKSYKKLPKCSSRIEELATPRRRQCLDNWRDNYNILPVDMVNRLKEHVFNQRPIVRVDDAIRCFRSKRKKKKPTRYAYKQQSVSPKRPIMSVKDIDALKCLCKRFAGKISKQLITPQKIRLNLQQQRVAQIVARDIKHMMRSPKTGQKRFTYEYNELEYKKIVSEISTMVSVWIATILDVTSDRLLEEELLELEEEEGPALDILESIMDVIGKSEHYFVTPSETSSESDNKNQGNALELLKLEPEQKTDETGNLNELERPEEIEMPPVAAEDQAKVEVENKTNYTVKEDETSPKTVIYEDSIKFGESSKDMTLTSSNFKQEDEYKPEHFEDKGEPDNFPGTDLLDDDSQETDDIKATDHHSVTIFLDKDKQDNIQDSSDPEKSEDNEVANIVQEEKNETEDLKQSKSSPDTAIVDIDQPVFKDIETSERYPGTELINDRKLPTEISLLEDEELVEANNTINREDDEEKRVTFDALGADQQAESETKHKISADSLNPPNYNILNEADESWPDDLVLPMNPNPFKGVNKSVTSLGNIQEYLEKNETSKAGREKSPLNNTTEEYFDALALEQPKQDSISSQTVIVTENKALETEFEVKHPAPIIPFNKSTEIGEFFFTEIKEGDRLKELNIEIENKSEQTTEEVKDQTLPIREELQSVTQVTFRSIASITKETANSIVEIIVDDTVTQSEEHKAIVKEPDEQISTILESPETEQHNKTVDYELYQSVEELDIDLKPITEDSDELADVKSRETKDSQSKTFEFEVFKAMTNATDETTENKSENKLLSESVIQEHKEEKLDLRSSGESPQMKSEKSITDVRDWVDTQANITSVTNSITQESETQEPVNEVSAVNAKKETATQEIEKKMQEVADKTQVKHDKKNINKENAQKICEFLAKGKRNSKLDQEQRPDSNRHKIVLDLTKHLASTKFNDVQKTKKNKPTKPKADDKNFAKITKEVRSDAKESKHPCKVKPKAPKQPLCSIPVKSTTEVKPIVVGEPLKAKLNHVEQPTVQPKFDYKVCLETAPSWVLNQGKGEPSESSLLTHIKETQRLKERKLRQWCHDLEVTAINLEKWSDWINDASANVMYLKRHKRRDRMADLGDTNKDWTVLKTCIDKDTLLWLKLYHTAARKLARYNSMLKHEVEPSKKTTKCPCRKDRGSL